MFSFATGTDACLASFDFLAACWSGPTANLSRLSFDGVVRTLSAFAARWIPAVQVPERRGPCLQLQVLFKLREFPVTVWQTFRPRCSSNGKYFFDLDDDGQAPESVLFLLFGRKRFIETFPPPSILRFRFGFGFTGFRSRLFTHFSWHVDFRCAPTSKNEKYHVKRAPRLVSINWCRDWLHTLGREISGEIRLVFSARRLRASRLDSCPSEDYLENLWNQGTRSLSGKRKKPSPSRP